jgi:hypothetical protein
MAYKLPERMCYGASYGESSLFPYRYEVLKHHKRKAILEV